MQISINMGDVVYIFKCEKKRNSFVRRCVIFQIIIQVP